MPTYKIPGWTHSLKYIKTLPDGEQIYGGGINDPIEVDAERREHVEEIERYLYMKYGRIDWSIDPNGPVVFKPPYTDRDKYKLPDGYKLRFQLVKKNDGEDEND